MRLRALLRALACTSGGTSGFRSALGSLQEDTKRRQSLGDALADALQENAKEVTARLLRAVRSDDDRTAVAAIKEWTRIFYGRSLERTEDETPADTDPLDVALMTREQRLALVRGVSREQPDLARSILGPSAVDPSPNT